MKYFSSAYWTAQSDSKIRNLSIPISRVVSVWGLVLFSSCSMANDVLDEMTLQDLMNMEMVSSSKFKQDLADVTASAYVISAQDIKNSGATDLPSLLKLVPGLFVAEVTSSGWAMGIRGFNSLFSNKMLVMIDGRSLFSPVFSGVFWEQLDLFIPDIERIEVIRGVGSTVWGANAVNGVVNIITKSTLDNESSQFYATVGDHNKYDAGLRFGAEVGEQSYVRFYAKSKEINNSTFEDTDEVLEDDWSSNAVGFKWERYDGPTSILLSGDLIEQDVGDTSLVTSRTMDNAVREDNRNLNVSFQWQRQVSVDKAYTLSSQVQNTKRDSDFFRIDDHMLNLDFDTNFKWQDHQILVGLGARQHDIEFYARTGYETTSGSQVSISTSRILSAYIQDEWSLNEANSVIIGTKFESHYHKEPAQELSYKSNVWLPTLRYRLDLTENSRLWMAVSRSVRMPSILEHAVKIPFLTLAPEYVIFPPPIPSPSPWPYELYTSGNLDYEKEDLLSYELGFRANINESNSVDVVAYWNHYDDVRAFALDYPYCESNGLPYPLCNEQDKVIQNHLIDNLGELTIKGFEISWKHRFSDSLTTVSHYAYANMDVEPLEEFQSFEETVLMTPKHQFTLQLDWQINEQLNLHLLHKYVGGIDDRELPYLQLRDNFLDHYHSLDLVFGYQWSIDKQLTLSIRNLLQSNGQRWAAEFPTARASNVDKRINLGFDIKF